MTEVEFKLGVECDHDAKGWRRMSMISLGHTIDTLVASAWHTFFWSSCDFLDFLR